MLRSSRPSLDAYLSDLHDLVGPLSYRHHEALPGALAQLQAALLPLADQPEGGVALFRLSEEELDAAATVLTRLNAAAETLAPGLVRALDVVSLRGGARAVVVLSPMPSLTRWAGPPDLRPVPGASLDDLEEFLVERAPQDVSAEELAAIPDLWGEPERALIALGAPCPWRGSLLPTVAGLLTYGAFDREVLPGQRIVERARGDELPRLGDIGEMIEAPVESLHQLVGLPRRIASAILVNALALRRWDGRDEPVFLDVREGRATVLCPDTRLADWNLPEGQRPNPNLDALLRRLAIARRPPLDLRTLQQDLRRAGLPPMAVAEEADKVVLTLRASAEAIARIQAEEAADPRASWERPTVEVRAPSPVSAPRPPSLPRLPAGSGAPPAAPGPNRPIWAPPPPAVPSIFARAVLPPPAASRPAPRSAQAPRPSPAPASPRLPAEARAAQLLALLAASPDPLTRDQIVRALAWSRSTARAVLAGLVADGRVAQEADAPRSPRQRYRAA